MPSAADAHRRAIDAAAAAFAATLRADDPAAAASSAAAMERLLRLPALQDIALRGAVERWLAIQLAGGAPRSDPLLNEAARVFDWDRPGYRPGSPAIAAILQRRALWQQVAMLAEPDHALHRGWRALTRADRPRWRRWLEALDPRVRHQVRLLVAHIAAAQPGLHAYVAPEAFAWWQSHVARPRLADALPLLPICWLLSAAAVAAARGRIVADGATAALALLLGAGLGIGYALLVRPRLAAWWARHQRAGGATLWVGGLVALPAVGLLLPASPAGLGAAAVLGALLLGWQDASLPLLGPTPRLTSASPVAVRQALLLATCGVFLGGMGGALWLQWLTVAGTAILGWQRGKGGIVRVALGRAAWLRRAAIAATIGAMLALAWPWAGAGGGSIVYRASLAVLACWGLLAILAALEPVAARTLLVLLGYLGLTLFWFLAQATARQEQPRRASVRWP